VPVGTTVVVKQRLPHRPASPLPASILPRAAEAAEWRHGSRHPLFPEKLTLRAVAWMSALGRSRRFRSG